MGFSWQEAMPVYAGSFAKVGNDRLHPTASRASSEAQLWRRVCRVSEETLDRLRSETRVGMISDVVRGEPTRRWKRRAAPGSPWGM